MNGAMVVVSCKVAFGACGGVKAISLDVEGSHKVPEKHLIDSIVCVKEGKSDLATGCD